MATAKKAGTKTSKDASTAAAANPDYELLDGTVCNPPLPQNAIVCEINFGRFITLKPWRHTPVDVATVFARSGIDQQWHPPSL